MAIDSFHEILRTRFVEMVPHCRDTGIVITACDVGGATAELPYRDDWLADPERGLLHPGIVTTLVDSASGAAVIARLESFDVIATIDLRMDYLRPAFRDRTVHCRAECYRLATSIAFVRATVWQDDRAEPVALSQSVFMRGARGRGPLNP